MSKLPSQEELLELLIYDPDSGELTWKTRDRKWFEIPSIKNPKRAQAVWNAKFAGKPALSTPGDDDRRQGYLLRKMLKAHRVIWKMVYGVEPDTIDHIDGDASNNRLVNLRDVSQSDNMKNVCLRSDNKTGFHGVHFDKERGLFMAYITADGKRKQLGRYKTVEEAAAIRAEAENGLGFHENHGRAAA